MKVELKKAYVNLELLKAEVSGRGADTKKLEKLWAVICTILCLISLSPVLLLIFKTDWTLPKETQESSSPRMVTRTPAIAQVSDDEIDMTPKQLTETMMYSAAQRREAIELAQMKGVPIEYKYDSKGNLEYHVTYPINIRVE